MAKKINNKVLTNLKMAVEDYETYLADYHLIN